MNACSDRCGWCGRCTSGPDRRRERPDALRPFTADEHAYIRRGLAAVGLDRDYFGFYDIDHLRKLGKSPQDVIDEAIRMEALARRYRERTSA